jgi:ADP-L-glycero-D-manno-heptose 6-epimerase
MKIFITGSTGFLGKSIIEQLPQYSYFKYCRGFDIIKNLDEYKPDVILHCAGEIYNEPLMYSSNVELTNKILHWASINSSVKLIYFGSSSEYGLVSSPMKETDICRPVSLYALTKLLGTQGCIKNSQFGGDVTIVRPFSVYGKNEPSKRLIPTIYHNLKHRLPIQLIKGEHDFIYIDDFVRAVNVLINAPKQHGEIYNIGFGIPYQNEDILYKFLELMNINFPNNIEFLDQRKNCDSKQWVCDNTKLKQKFNFTFEFDLDKGLKEYIYIMDSKI